MANLKTIAATLAVLGSGALVMGCNKEKQTTETPDGGGAADGGDAAADDADAAADDAAAAAGGEATCGEGHTEEGHCGAKEGGEAPPAEGGG